MANTDMEFDVCIIGSGAGAGPIAYELAKAGKFVAILEKGPWITEKDFFKDEIAVSRRPTYTPPLHDEPHIIEDYSDDAASWKEQTNAETGRSFWNGNMVGGSSNLMSGFFHRLKPIDFRLLSEFGPVENAHVADWPITYDELEPYYTKVEEIVGVSGRIVDHPFQEPRSTPDFPYPPLAEHAMAKHIDNACKNLGFHSVPTPRAILPKPALNRLGCAYSGYCGSYGCNTAAKGSSRAALLNPAVETGNCTVLPWSKAYKIVTNAKGKATKVLYHTRIGIQREIHAKTFVVACQAVESVRLLLLSSGPKYPYGLGNHSGLLGKNLIFSAGGVGYTEFNREQFDEGEFEALKNIHLFVNRSLQEWYIAHYKGQRIKGGTIDFLMRHANPVRYANSLKWDKNRLLWGSALKHKVERSFKGLAQLNYEIFCDWHPNDDCFVALSGTKDRFGIPVAKIRTGHHKKNLIPAHLLAEKAEETSAVMNGQNTYTNLTTSPPPNLMAGGIRFGSNPDEAVLDKNCKVYNCPNVYVSDGSFMPTGGSVTPTWTIYANAFRIADKILGCATT